MKQRFLLIMAISLLCIFLASGPQQSAYAYQAGAYLYTRATPAVIYADGRDSTTLEVFTSNQNVAEVSLKAYYQENWQLLYDDGTHGDRTAGDGVFTLDGVTTEMLPPDMWLFNGKAGSASFDVQVAYSNGQPADMGYALLNVVDPGVKFPVQQVAPNMVASEYGLFVADPEGLIYNGEPYPVVDQYINLSTATRMFYDIYPDDFDFLVVMPIHPNYRPTYAYSEGPVPFNTTVRAAAENIGVDDYYIDTSIDYGSPERLKSVIYHSAGYGSMLAHEIGHTWCVFIGGQAGLQDQMTAHWNAYSDLGGIMGMYVTPYSEDPATEMERSSVGLPTNFNLRANPDSTFQLIDAHGYKQFIPLDLYLMGLIPPEEIPPVNILTNPDFNDPERITAQQVKTYSYQEIIDLAGGLRQPAYPDAQREFNIGFIFFSDGEFSAAEIAWGSLVAREITLEESNSINTFYHATGGLATLNANLSAWDNPNLSASTTATTDISQPKIIASGLAILGNEDSFDFVNGKMGNLTGGDLYIYRAGAADFQALANNIPQIGGQLLFDADKAVAMGGEIFDASHFIANTETIQKINSASTMSNFTYFDVPLEKNAVYLYIRHQPPGDYVLFRVASIDSDQVTLDYAVFEMSD